MILQALHDLHDRLEADPNYDVAPEGYSLQQISFVIVLEPDGTLVDIQDHRLGEGNQHRAQMHRVPGTSKPSGAGINPCLFWDNTGYLLGYKVPDKDEVKAKKDAERAIKSFEASREHHLAHEKSINHPVFSAICRFFESWSPENSANHSKLADIATGFGVFQIRGANHFVHEEPAIEAWWQESLQAGETSSEEDTFCLITGQRAPIAELHEPKIKGVKDAQGAGALIVSFNKNAYESYGKSSGENAPVSKTAANKYCKTLNALLATRRHRLGIGDATTVFWTDAPTYTNTESVINQFLGGGGGNPETDADDDTPAQQKQLLTSLHATLRALRSGGEVDPAFLEEKDRTFYILGLTGQAGGRIGVRFWHRSTVEELLRSLAKHHDDLAIQREWEPGPKIKNPDPEFPQIWQILRQTARESKDIPPNLGGALMRSILTMSPYPQMLAGCILSRIRADRTINYLRVASLKAWLVRNHQQSVPMTYNPDKPESAYRLGALFALLEKTQQDALGDVNAGIRDRYYSSASATPASVFPRLLRTYQHHLSKAGSRNKGYQIHREREVQTILAEPEPMEAFPSHLNMKEQGLFAIGYYHKRKDIWTKKADPSSAEPDPDDLEE